MTALICQQIWKIQQWPQDWKGSVSILIPKKGNAKECSSYCTTALISHICKVMLKIPSQGSLVCCSPWGCRVGLDWGTEQQPTSLWQLCPIEDWVWRWHSCLGCGDLGGTTVQGYQLLQPRELWHYWSLFLASGSWRSKGLFGWLFSVWNVQALKRPPCFVSLFIA